MHLRKFTLLLFLGSALLAPAIAQTTSIRRDAPKLDTQKIINDSYSFRKNQEPEMSEDEYALYERVVSMVSTQPEFALKLLETLTSGNQPKSPAFEFVLGNVYFGNNRPDLAEQHYRKALEQFPSFVRVWSNLGSMYYGQARFAEAADCLRKTVSLGERDAHTLGLLAYCLDKTGRQTAAEMNYVQALGLDPDNPEYLEGLLSIYYQRQQYAAAEILLKQLIKLRPREARHWLLYGSLLTAQNRPVDAIATLESAGALGVLDVDGMLVLIELYAGQRFDREAIETFGRLRAKSPDLGTEHLCAYVQSLIADRRLTAATEALASLKGELSPKQRVLVSQARVDLLMAQENWTGAAEELQRLLQLEPLNGRALLSLGRARKAEGNLAGAEVALEMAAQTPAFAYRAYLELADIGVRTRRYERALEFLEKAAAIEKSVVIQNYIAKVSLLIPEKDAGSP